MSENANPTTNPTTEIPDLATLSKMYYSDTKAGTKTQISLIEEVPALEEAPEQITGSAVDIDYEFSKPGKTKAGAIEIPVYYTHTQHKRLKQIERKNKFFFVEYPESTAPDGEEPLVKMFQGSLTVVGDTLTDDNWIKDKITIYRTTAVEEMYGLPTTTPTS